MTQISNIFKQSPTVNEKLIPLPCPRFGCGKDLGLRVRGGGHDRRDRDGGGHGHGGGHGRDGGHGRGCGDDDPPG